VTERERVSTGVEAVQRILRAALLSRKAFTLRFPTGWGFECYRDFPEADFWPAIRFRQFVLKTVAAVSRHSQVQSVWPWRCHIASAILVTG